MVISKYSWIEPDDGLEMYWPSLFKPGTIQKLACFDMDGTLIKTRSGKKFPKDADDWDWLVPGVPSQLKQLSVEGGYGLVICTNQSKFSLDTKTKIQNICQILELPIVVLVSTGHTKYRKPMVGMWDYLIGLMPTIQKEQCFYVGDAIDNTIDHSNCDLYWAHNVGIPFHFAPTYFGLSTKRVIPKPIRPDFTQCFNKGANIADILAYDVVIMYGPPAIGKSQLTATLVETGGFKSISMDNFQTKSQYNQELIGLLKETFGKVVIDNNNHTIEKRREVVDKIRQIRPTACIVVVILQPTDNQREIAQYLNYHRCYLTGKWIPDVVYHTYYKYSVKPTKQEGFDILEYYPAYSGFDKYY